MTEREKAVRKFQRAAEQRWLTANWLLMESEFYLDAVYLAGYAVECALKSLILWRTSERRFPEAYAEITEGRKAHSYEFLKQILQRRPINMVIPKPLMVLFRRVATWSTDLRYESRRIAYDEAQDFFEAVTGIRTWIDKELA
jgi:HEPN domain